MSNFCILLNSAIKKSSLLGKAGIIKEKEREEQSEAVKKLANFFGRDLDTIKIREHALINSYVSSTNEYKLLFMMNKIIRKSFLNELQKQEEAAKELSKSLGLSVYKGLDGLTYLTN